MTKSTEIEGHASCCDGLAGGCCYGLMHLCDPPTATPEVAFLYSGSSGDGYMCMNNMLSAVFSLQNLDADSESEGEVRRTAAHLVLF